MRASLAEIATKVHGKVIGDETILVSALSPIDDIAAGTLVFAEGEQNVRKAEQSAAAVILVNQQTSSQIKPVIQTAHPFKAFISLLEFFYPAIKPAATIHPTAVIAEDAIIGKQVSIGPCVVIGSGAKIGNNSVIKSHVHIGNKVVIGAETVIHSHVTIYDSCEIGAKVCIHAGSVIGSDGFGYTFIDNAHLKVPHVGRVIIEDEVEIGANTTIDRATLGATIIGAGTKIDNLVQIAHSVKLGKQNIVCGFTGIAGSTVSGNNVIFAANVGVSDHVRIDDGVILTARTGVAPKKHLRAGNVYFGNPARPKAKAVEQELSITRIPLMRKNLMALTKKVNDLAKRLTQLATEQ